MTVALPVRPFRRPGNPSPRMPPASPKPTASPAAGSCRRTATTSASPPASSETWPPSPDWTTRPRLSWRWIATPTVRGQGVTHRGGWRLHFSADWICTRCTPAPEA